MPMENPSHPGSIVRYDCLEPLGLSVTEAAKVLRVSRQTLNNLVNGKAGVSAETAVRLSKAFRQRAGILAALANELRPGRGSPPRG